MDTPSLNTNPTNASTAPKQKKKKTWLIILLSVLGTLLVLIGIFVFYVFGGFTGNPTKEAHSFLDLLAESKIDEAYDSTAQVFKDSTPKESFSQFIEQYPIIKEFKDVKFSGVERETRDGKDISTVSGEITGSDDKTSPIQVILISEEGKGWKVATIDLRNQTEE